MGTWMIPDSLEKMEKASELVTKIKNIQEELYYVIGDDSLFDHLDGAINRIQEIMALVECEIM